eukprot:15282455-Ditylum_brightwellii.AAC.1
MMWTDKGDTSKTTQLTNAIDKMLMTIKQLDQQIKSSAMPTEQHAKPREQPYEQPRKQPYEQLREQPSKKPREPSRESHGQPMKLCPKEPKLIPQTKGRQRNQRGTNNPPD